LVDEYSQDFETAKLHYKSDRQIIIVGSLVFVSLFSLGSLIANELMSSVESEAENRMAAQQRNEVARAQQIKKREAAMKR
tara:strand:- start:91 stop:330 length:240 start_codon:yes stop_codon:yes gene_type:complete